MFTDDDKSLPAFNVDCNTRLEQFAVDVRTMIKNKLEDGKK